MQVVQIEKGVVLAGLRVPAKSGRQRKYPFDRLNVAESFLVPVPENEKNAIVQRRVFSCGLSYGKRTKKEFSTRVVEGGIRCWRVK